MGHRGGRKAFKLIKGQIPGENCYEVPEQLLHNTGIQMISESGIVKRGTAYEKTYFCEENAVDASNVEKIKGCTMLLRGADVNFCFYEDFVEKRVVLLIRLEGKSFIDISETFRAFEDDVQSNLHTFGITLHPMNANERLRCMHRLVMSDQPGSRMDVNSYLASGWLDWISDMDMKNRAEEGAGIRILDGNEGRCVYYIPRILSEHTKEVCQIIKAFPACRLLVTCFEPVDDKMVAAKIKNEYFSADNIFSYLIRKRHGIGSVLENEGENQRKYVFAGIYFVLGSEIEHLPEIQSLLEKKLQEYQCKMVNFPYELRAAYRNLFTLRPWELQKTNLIQTADAVKMNPFYREGTAKKEEKESDIYLRLFDEMM